VDAVDWDCDNTTFWNFDFFDGAFFGAFTQEIIPCNYKGKTEWNTC